MSEGLYVPGEAGDAGVRHIAVGDSGTASEAAGGGTEEATFATAFLVLIDRDGDVHVAPDPATMSHVVVERMATHGDIIRACSEQLRRMNNAEIAERTVVAMLATTHQIAQQQEAAALAGRLGNLRG